MEEGGSSGEQRGRERARDALAGGTGGVREVTGVPARFCETRGEQSIGCFGDSGNRRRRCHKHGRRRRRQPAPAFHGHLCVPREPGAGMRSGRETSRYGNRDAVDFAWTEGEAVSG